MTDSGATWQPISALDNVQEAHHIRFLFWLVDHFHELSNGLRPRVSEKTLRLYARYEKNVTPENIKLLLEKAAELQRIAVKWTGEKPFISMSGMTKSRGNNSREVWEDFQYDVENMAQALGLWDVYKKV